jgi:hypothetical protein
LGRRFGSLLHLVWRRRKLPPHGMGRVGVGGFDGRPLPTSPMFMGEEKYLAG